MLRKEGKLESYTMLIKTTHTNRKNRGNNNNKNNSNKYGK